MSCKTITVFSSKGGVGKTLVAVNLATALALAKHKVLLVDFDLQAGQDMVHMLNITPKRTIVEILPVLGTSTDSELISQNATKHASGMDFLPLVGSTRQISQITADNIQPFFQKAMASYDFIVVDGGKSFTEILLTTLDHSNLIFLVGTPDILSVYQIKWCLEVLQSLQFPLKMVKIILNRSESHGSVAWQEVRSFLQYEIFFHIPSDGKVVGLALNSRIPCVSHSPKSGIAEAFTKMAHIINKETLYVPTTDLTKTRSANALETPGQFWDKYGISQQMTRTSGEAFIEPEDETISLRLKVHEKLVERLNLNMVTTDVFDDPQAIQKLKKTAEEVIGNIIMEESGGKLTSHEQRLALVRDIINEALGLGPLEDFLADPSITDIMVNSKDEVYVEKSGKLILTNKRFISNAKMRGVIDRIIAPLGRRIDESTPMVDARLLDGSRINAIIPPLSLKGPMNTIRKFMQEKLEVSDLLAKYHTLSESMAKFLHACVLGRKNMIVSGGTGAGKTTLLNVLSEFIPDGERIITIEDAAELRLKKSHWARLESRPPNIEGKGQVTIRDLFVNCLRMRPDRIVIGECRGGEVLDMLQAMNTGHDGSMTTLHANTTRDALTRMSSMILLSGIELPMRAINEMIGSAINIIVQINRFSDGTRKITGITEVAGLDKEFQPQLEDVFTYQQKGVDKDGKIIGDFEATGYRPKCFDALVARGIALKEEIFKKSGA